MIAISNAISIGLNRLGGGGPGPGPDPDAQAYFDRVVSAGGVLTEAEQNAVNQLVIDMKANGTWTPMKAVYPMVGSSAAACAQNLKSSSFTGTFSSGWTFASTGVTPNGTSAFMNTGFIPITNFLSQNNISFGYYNNGNMTSPSTEMGSANAGFGNGSYLIVNVTNSSYNRVSSNATQAYNASPYTTGLYSLSRIVSTQFKYYKNSTILNTAAIASSGLTSNTFWAAGGVNYGSAAEYGGGRCAFSWIGDGLTDTEVSNLYTAVQAFQTTLNRAIAP